MDTILFNDMLEKFTEYDFHDASLFSISYNYKDELLQLSITHFRGTNTNNLDIMIRSDLCFEKTENLSIDNVYELFFLKPEINSFEEKNDGDVPYYELIGIAGWVLKFEAGNLYYSEEVIGEY